MRSLLRYPGGKSRAVKYILPFFPKNLERICSPFFGGGSIEFALASKGIVVSGYDLFAPLVCFWQEVKNNKKKLADQVQKHFPLSKENFYAHQFWLQRSASMESSQPKTNIAASFYAVNRSSFSGSTLSGGMSPGHPRFNQNSINRLKAFNMERVSVELADFSKSIKEHSSDFLYCDPPYLLKNSKLYGDRGDKHFNFDHEKLNSLLTKRDGWILSYNDCPEIREMYKDYEILNPEWKYGMSKKKDSNEILIVNSRGKDD